MIALTDHGRDRGDKASLFRAITVLTDAFALATARQRARLGGDPEQPRHHAPDLGERETGTARLEEAVAAYRAALEERTRERVPLDWAATQNNLGLALAVSRRERERHGGAMAQRAVEPIT